MAPGMLKGGVKGMVVGTLGAAAGVGIGQITPGMPLDDAALAAIGNRVGSFVGGVQYWYKQGAGSMYADLRETGVNHDLARNISAISGAPYALIEYSQVDKIIPGLGTFAKKSILNSSKKVINRAIAKYGKNWITEVGEEGMQEMISTVSLEVGMALDDKVKGNPL